MMEIPDALSIMRFHEKKLADARWPCMDGAATEGGIWTWIAANHYYNTQLWNEEDKARRTDVSAHEIAGGKRLIDQYNQKRNDATEAVDEAVLGVLGDFTQATDASVLGHK